VVKLAAALGLGRGRLRHAPDGEGSGQVGGRRSHLRVLEV